MWLLAINPTAGNGKGAESAIRVIDFFVKHSLPYQTFSAASALDLRRDIESYLEDNQCQGIVSIGGDGLAHLILQIATPRRLPFALIPAGTGNDIVRSLGFSLDDIDGYLTRVTTTNPQEIDLGNVDSEWFAAILSMGFDSVVNERANRLTWPRGRQRYNVSIALELAKFSPLNYQITTDNRTFVTQAMLIAVGNGRSYGGGMLVCPHAKMNDGLFDVVIVKPISKIEFLKVFPKVFSGSHLSHPAVENFRTRKISITADAIAYADGERIGPAPILAECVRAAGLTWTL